MPEPLVLGFLAGASVVRRHAVLDVGGFEPRFFLGGEEQLLAIDLRAAGWCLAYVDDVVVHHHPSPRRDIGRRVEMNGAGVGIFMAWDVARGVSRGIWAAPSRDSPRSRAGLRQRGAR